MSNTQTVSTISDLKSLSTATPLGAFVLGYASPGDGGGGLFYWDSGATEPDDGGTVIASGISSGGRWKRVWSGSLNVRWFGARGDGVTDDYDALHRAVKAVNDRKGHVVLLFPPGTYYIDRYKITGGCKKNDVQDMLFHDCCNFNITGYGACVKVKGSFDRSRGYQHDTNWYSYANCVQPFIFENCTDFSIEGLEIDGSVDQMTRGDLVVESPGSGIVTHNCSNYIMSNLYVHRFHTDGILLGQHHTHADSNAMLSHVTSKNNARDALSIIQVSGCVCIACEFSYSGITGGAYGGHAPQSGVDIEPDFLDLLVKTGNILFIACEFRGNEGHQFVAGLPKTYNITLDHCRIIRETTNNPYVIILGAINGYITHSYIECDSGYIIATYQDGCSTKIADCEIRSSTHGIASEREVDLLIERCRFIGTFTAPTIVYQPLLRNSRCRFIDNYVFRPQIVYEGHLNTRTFAIASILEVQEARDNTFDTDLKPTSDEHFATSYAATTVVCYDKYTEGTAFRPHYNWVWPTSSRIYSNQNCKKK
jgi:hypothetical protein